MTTRLLFINIYYYSNLDPGNPDTCGPSVGVSLLSPRADHGPHYWGKVRDNPYGGPGVGAEGTPARVGVVECITSLSNFPISERQ